MRPIPNERNTQVYQQIIQYKSQYDGLSPTVRELATLTGLCNEAVITSLRQLTYAGLIHYSGTQTNRAIMVAGGKWTLTTDTSHPSHPSK